MSDTSNQPNKNYDKTPEQLEKYRNLNVTHLSWSFWSSLVSLFAGLVALLSGVYLVMQGNTGLSSQLTVIGGVLTEFIGAGFFILYSKNVKQLNIFYERLIKHQDVLYAISLTREAPEAHRADLIKAIIGKLLTTNEPPTPPDVLKAILESNNRG